MDTHLGSVRFAFLVMICHDAYPARMPCAAWDMQCSGTHMVAGVQTDAWGSCVCVLHSMVGKYTTYFGMVWCGTRAMGFSLSHFAHFSDIYSLNV